MLEHFVRELEAAPHSALDLTYVVDAGISLRKSFNRAFFICKGFHCSHVRKRFLGNRDHFTLRFLVRFIVLSVEVHEHSVAEETWGDEKQSIKSKFPAVGKHDYYHANDRAEGLYKRRNARRKSVLNYLGV